MRFKIQLQFFFKKIANNVTTIFGNGSKTSIDGPVSNATIIYPMGISIHPITQEVYIAESGGGLTANIRSWNRTSQTVGTVINLGSTSNSPSYIDFLNDGTLFIITELNGLLQLFTNG